MRRLRIGTTDFSAEIRGYQDRYRARAVVQTSGITVFCSCESGRAACGHAAALLIDLDRNLNAYCEAPWDLARTTNTILSAWPFQQTVDWGLIPEGPPSWRRSYRETDSDWLAVELQRAQSGRLDRDPMTRIWAELDPTWLEHAAVQQLFAQWLERYLGAPVHDQALWALLHWMQPNLTLSPIISFLTNNAAAAQAFMEFLWRPHLIRATPERLLTCLADLTVVDPTLAQAMWPQYARLDPGSLAEADAWYRAGNHPRAIRLLEQHLSDDPLLRHQARVRLAAWMSLEDSVPHRIALALESRSTEPVEPVRHLIDREAWQSLVTSLGAEPRTASVTDEPQ